MSISSITDWTFRMKNWYVSQIFATLTVLKQIGRSVTFPDREKLMQLELSELSKVRNQVDKELKDSAYSRLKQLRDEEYRQRQSSIRSQRGYVSKAVLSVLVCGSVVGLLVPTLDAVELAQRVVSVLQVVFQGPGK